MISIKIWTINLVKILFRLFNKIIKKLKIIFKNIIKILEKIMIKNKIIISIKIIIILIYN